MSRQSAFAIALAILFVRGNAFAANLDVVVTDTGGKPAVSAVVSLEPVSGNAPRLGSLAGEAVIDQQHETFIPLVRVIRRGGSITFTNNDHTTHQVYSFSPIKQFEYEIDKGQHSPAVVFDKPGIAAIGCNIHDNMVAFVYVADSPWTAMTDASGHAQLHGVPAGNYHASVWHPKLIPGRQPPVIDVAVSELPSPLSLKIPLLGGEMPGTRHMHMGSY